MNSFAQGTPPFKGLVQWVLRETVAEVGKRLQAVLAALDEELQQEQPPGWESAGLRRHRWTTLFGLEIEVQRRLYRRRVGKKVEYRYPLDEMLGLRRDERYCPLVHEMAVTLAARMSFREAAEILREYLGVAVSHQQVHRWMQEAGTDRAREQQAEVAAVMERGEYPAGEQGAEAVFLEADGVYLPLQRESGERIEAKLGVMHAGWEPETPAGKRYRLRDKVSWGGVMTSQGFWEQGAVLFHSRYDREKVGRVVLGGDGAEWIKEGQQHFAGAEYYLDRFHLNKALRQGLGFAPELLQEAYAALREGQLGQLKGVLARALAQAPGEVHVERVKELRRYLRPNWDGLVDWRRRGDAPAGARGMGVAEGQINHVVATRMTKRGMSWRIPGAHRMLQMRCLHAEGRLVSWVQGWQKRHWPAPVRTDRRHQPQRIIERLDVQDPGEWLQARVPVLASTAASSPLGRTLKRIAHHVSFDNMKWRAQPAPFGQMLFNKPNQTA